MQKIENKGHRLRRKVVSMLTVGTLLATTVIPCIATVGVYGENAESGVKVLYYETFDGGVEGITTDSTYAQQDKYSIVEQGATTTRNYYVKTDSYGKMMLYLGDSKSGNVYLQSEYNGNPGFTVHTGSSGTRSFYEFNEAVTTGVVAYSFDISRLSRDVNGEGGNKIAGGYTPLGRINMCTKWGDANADGLDYRYVLYMNCQSSSDSGELNGFYGPNSNLSNWGDAGTRTGKYDMNTVYHVEQVYDLNNRMCYTYIDGNEITGGGRTINGTQKIKTLDFFISKYAGYFDNLKITYSDKLYMNAESSDVSVTDNSITVMFSDGIDASALPREGYTIVDMETGIKYTAIASVVSTKKIAVASDELTLKDGGMYLVKIPSITGKGGLESGEQTISVNAGNGDKLNDFTLVDSRGDEHKNADKIPADIKKINLDFSSATAASNANIAITDKSGASVGFTKAQGDSAKQVVISLDKYLLGDGEYKISITGTDKDNEIKLATDKGSVKTAACRFYVNGSSDPVENLDNVSDGQSIKMVLDVVKTTGEEKEVLAAYSVKNGKALSGFDYAEKTMSAADDTASFEFNFTADSATDLSIKGFLKGALGMVNPIGEIFEIK